VEFHLKRERGNMAPDSDSKEDRDKVEAHHPEIARKLVEAGYVPKGYRTKLKSSAERSKQSGNVLSTTEGNESGPKDEFMRDKGKSIQHREVTDQLHAAVSTMVKAEEDVERLLENDKKLREDPLYIRDQKIYEEAKSGRLRNPTINPGVYNTEEEKKEKEKGKVESKKEEDKSPQAAKK
jgi:hypothetical protein